MKFFSVLQRWLARFASGLHWRYLYFCIHACAVSYIHCYENSFYSSLPFVLCFFYCFVHQKLRNEWRCFCACVNCCILWRVTRSVVRNFLFMYLSRVLIFSIACVILLLPYFSQCFCVLLVWFFEPNSLLLWVLLFVDLPQCHFLGFRNFALLCFASFCVHDFLHTLFWLRQFFLWCEGSFSWFIC